MAKPKTITEYLTRTEGTFAYPILSRVHEIILETAPNVEEAIKWGSPSYEYKGLMISTVKFKEFAAVWFHKGSLFDDPKNMLEASTDDTKYMRKYTLSTIEELDEEGLKNLIREAVKFQENGEKPEIPTKPAEKFENSDLLNEALEKDPVAKAEFEKFPPYKKKEFIELIETAKREATQQKRLKKSLDLIRQGIGLNDQYR